MPQIQSSCPGALPGLLNAPSAGGRGSAREEEEGRVSNGAKQLSVQHVHAVPFHLCRMCQNTRT